MDLTIASISEACCQELRRAGYKKLTILKYQKSFRRLAELSADGTLTDEAIVSFVDRTGPDGKPFSQNYWVFRKRIARLAKDFAENGTFELSRFDESPPQRQLQAELATKLEDFARYNEKRGLSPRTCLKYGEVAEEFLGYLQKIGMSDTQEVDGASVLEFLQSARGKWPRTPTKNITSILRLFLRWLGRDDLEDVLALAKSLTGRDISRVLEEREAEQVALTCLSGAVEARDASIALLCLTTGMRSSDVANLRLSDIDWRAMSISVVQKKTSYPVCVPMVTALAEKLGEYILCERPACDSDKVFLRKRAPHVPFCGGTAIYRSIRKTLVKAGVGIGGTRLLRHSAATSMLRAKVGLPVISAVLGHTDPRSADTYLECDEAGMVACVLPLPEGAKQ